MNINLNTINEKGIKISQEVVFDETYYNNTIIKGLNNIKVDGRIYYSTTREIVFEGIVSGEMIIVDSNTNELVNYPFTSQINEILERDEDFSQNLGSKDKNMLDLEEILWQNIVLEVPLTFSKVSKPTLTKGDGWELKSEEEVIDPRLQGFRDLLEKGKEN